MNVLETARLLLREFVPADASFILQLLNEDGFVRFIGDKGVRSLRDARDYILQGPVASYAQHGFGLYLTSLRDGTPIGMSGLVKRDTLPDPDVGFAFLERYWSKGYAAESATAVLEYGHHRLGLERIVAITAPDNHGSMAVLNKIGLRFERKIILTDGREVNLFGPGASSDA